MEANKLDLSLSKVNYADICQHVGLLARKQGDDIPTFDMHRARLPEDFFWDYLEDIKIATFQYGPPESHYNEEATLRYISSVSNTAPLTYSLLMPG